MSIEKAIVLEVKDLHKSFGELEVLQGIDFCARQNEVVAILGSSGSGKSTLLRCLNFLEQINSGDYYFQSQKLELDNKEHMQNVRSKMSMVFQQFNLWSHMTVLENIIEAPIQVLKISKAEAIARAEKLLLKVGMSAKRDVFPSRLSGGQQQRVAIARALAMEPEVLLFDEPTSSLDPELVAEVLQVMQDLAAEGRTMLVVTHEMQFARDVADRVLYLDQGKIAAQGKAEEMFSNRSDVRFQKFISASSPTSVIPS